MLDRSKIINSLSEMMNFITEENLDRLHKSVTFNTARH